MILIKEIHLLSASSVEERKKCKLRDFFPLNIEFSRLKLCHRQSKEFICISLE